MICKNCGKPIAVLFLNLIHVETGIVWCKPLEEFPRAEIA